MSIIRLQDSSVISRLAYRKQVLIWLSQGGCLTTNGELLFSVYQFISFLSVLPQTNGMIPYLFLVWRFILNFLQRYLAHIWFQIKGRFACIEPVMIILMLKTVTVIKIHMLSEQLIVLDLALFPFNILYNFWLESMREQRTCYQNGPSSLEPTLHMNIHTQVVTSL